MINSLWKLSPCTKDHSFKIGPTYLTHSHIDTAFSWNYPAQNLCHFLVSRWVHKIFSTFPNCLKSQKGYQPVFLKAHNTSAWKQCRSTIYWNAMLGDDSDRAIADYKGNCHLQDYFCKQRQKMKWSTTKEKNRSQWKKYSFWIFPSGIILSWWKIQLFCIIHLEVRYHNNK